MNVLKNRFLFLTLLSLLLPLFNACGLPFISGMQRIHKGLTCDSCHQKNGDSQYALRNEGNPSNLCNSCHNYENPQDHHPFESSGSSLDVPYYFRVRDGKMDCLTCHKVHSGANYRQGTQNLLVGGAYSDRRAICFKCHKKEAYKNINPHTKMLLPDKTLNYYTCRLCHASPPNPEIDGTEDVEFKAAIHFLCWRCHPPMNSDFFDIHFLKKDKVKSFNLDLMHGFSGGGTFDTMKEKEENNDFILPLDPRGRLTCSTCHNPHQPGVMVNRKAAKGAGSKNRLRLTGKCSDCHDSQ